MFLFSVIGNFLGGKNSFNGQTVKTRIVTNELFRRFGNQSGFVLDTYGGIKTLIKAPFMAFNALKNSKNILIFPAHNAIRLFIPLLVFLQLFFRNRRIHYVVIGGWLLDFLRTRFYLKFALKRVYRIYAETKCMKRELESIGFTNVVYMPNCKELPIVDVSDLLMEYQEPYALCTFSRVWSMKGIADAAQAVQFINAKMGRTLYTLDIYGQIEQGEEAWFENLQSTFTEAVKYKGTVDFNQSVSVLKRYFALLFPTKYLGEGIPGTIIDAYAAGIPVISSLYPNFSEIIDDGVTGMGYEFSNTDELVNLLIKIAEHPSLIINLKKNCVQKAMDFQPKNVIAILADEMTM